MRKGPVIWFGDESYQTGPVSQRPVRLYMLMSGTTHGPPSARYSLARTIVVLTIQIPSRPARPGAV